jgi:hypothetical protein
VANSRGSTAKRSTASGGQASRSLIIKLLKGETTAAEGARRHGLKVAEVEGSVAPEFVTHYTPEQNDLVERFFLSQKVECVWLYKFGSFTKACAAVTKVDRMVQR